MLKIKRTVGNLTYELTYKNVKNINLRIGSDLCIRVSANPRVPLEVIDNFVSKKATWIQNALEKLKNRESLTGQEGLLCQYTDEQCMELFENISEKIYPLFAHVLKEKPQIKVRLMKSRWGVCHVQKRLIVLNKLLVLKPVELIEYVVLHEYVHFLHPNHQKGFHDMMSRYMPDYKQRRQKLK